MLKQELKRLLKNKLLYVAFFVVLIVAFIGFYNATLADKDGNTYIVDLDTNERVHLTQYEKIEFQKDVCAPYLGRVLDDDMVEEFLNIMMECQMQQSQFIYEETPMLNIALSYMREMSIYSEERLESLGYGYRKVDIGDQPYIISSVDTFMEKNDLTEPIVVNLGNGWYNLLENLSITYMVGLIALVIVFISVFASDNRYNIRGLVLTTRYGRSRNILMRILSSLIVVSVLFIFITLVITVLYVSVYGIGGYTTPLYMTEFGAATLYRGTEMSVGDVYGQYVILGLACYFMITLFVIMVSAIESSEYVGAIISIILLLLPWITSKLFTINNPIMNSILNVMPINLFVLNASNNGVIWYLGKSALVNMGVTNAPVSFVVMLLFIYVSISLSFFTVTYIVAKRKEVS